MYSAGNPARPGVLHRQGHPAAQRHSRRPPGRPRRHRTVRRLRRRLYRLERGVLDAGITGGTPGYGQRWYEVTDYLYGPIVGSIGVTYITVNGDKWRQLSAENRRILKEVGDEFEAENRRLLREEWDPDGINLNVAEGMEYSDFPDDVKTSMRAAALETIIPTGSSAPAAPTPRA